MNVLPRIFECVRPPSPKIRPNALESSPFRLLPPELILMIASHLPPESAGILALSSTPLYLCLQTDYLKPLKGGKHPASYNFLDLLARDLPINIACPHCNKLHSTLFYKFHAVPDSRLLAWIYPPRKPLYECQRVDTRNQLNARIQPNFSSTLFRMAMKVYRQGHDTTKFLDLLSFRGPNIRYRGFTEQIIASARIVGGSLFIREQRVFMTPASQKYPLPGRESFYICYQYPYLHLQSLLRMGIQFPRSKDVEAHENKQGILCCEYCYTEFRIDFKSYGRAGNAMFITRWMDLGEGRDLNDPKWRNRLVVEEELFLRTIKHPRRSISAAFEQEHEFRFDSLLTGHELMTLRGMGYWLWPNNDVIWPHDNIKPEWEVINGRL